MLKIHCNGLQRLISCSEREEGSDFLRGKDLPPMLFSQTGPYRPKREKIVREGEKIVRILLYLQRRVRNCENPAGEENNNIQNQPN
jgi:hypothetical protein